ncbi:MAG: efflux RND transporter periplasmic adaptor subunit [Bacteroidetes bacterium]|nr:efflux RND transporter periplasmic adaptor subunit [Bacteroidota bacterium]
MRSKHRNALHTPAFLLLLLVAACGNHKKEATENKRSGPKMLRAEGYIVKPQSFQNSYATTGSLLPNEEVQIHPEVSGRVTKITFTEGLHVEKGQMLLQIYNDDVKAQLQKLRAQKQLQLKIEARQAELLRIGGISQQDYETTVTQIKSIDADIAYSEAQLRKTSIYAPFSGKVGIRNVSVGAVITPETVIATLQQTRQLKLDFTLPDQYRHNVDIGTQISFSTSGSLDTFSGKVIAIEPTADVTTRTLKVRALIENAEHKLVAGAFAHVTVPFENKSNALLIPSQAVIPTDRDKEVAVTRGGKVKMQTIVIGARTNDKVEVIQGLQEGDTVITTGIMQLKDKMPVTITRATDH